MMKTLIEQGRAMGLKVLTLSAFENNKRAIHVYEKVGFKKDRAYSEKVLQKRQVRGRSNNDPVVRVD